METASCKIKLSPNSEIFRQYITPAEGLLLVKEHRRFAKGFPLVDLKVHAVQKKIPVIVELARLSAKYGKRKVKECFPGEFPKLPETFEEAGLLSPTKWDEIPEAVEKKEKLPATEDAYFAALEDEKG